MCPSLNKIPHISSSIYLYEISSVYDLLWVPSHQDIEEMKRQRCVKKELNRPWTCLLSTQVSQMVRKEHQRFGRKRHCSLKGCSRVRYDCTQRKVCFRPIYRDWWVTGLSVNIYTKWTLGTPDLLYITCGNVSTRSVWLPEWRPDRETGRHPRHLTV